MTAMLLTGKVVAVAIAVSTVLGALWALGDSIEPEEDEDGGF